MDIKHDDGHVQEPDSPHLRGGSSEQLLCGDIVRDVYDLEIVEAPTVDNYRELPHPIAVGSMGRRKTRGHITGSTFSIY